MLVLAAVPRVIQHACLNSAEAVRGEVEFLTNDCNKRMAQVMYQTIVIVYYTTLIPCFFVPVSKVDSSGYFFIAFK